MKTFEQIINENSSAIQKIVDFDLKQDQLLPFDFTVSNLELTDAILNDTDSFSEWINQKLIAAKARYGIGGYNEHRTIYSRSAHFSSVEEPRRLHLGVDIWGEAGTSIYNFYDAEVHSFANNNAFGDYGATIILVYNIEGFKFHALYGHLNLASINHLKVGKMISAGEKIAELGTKEENGNWPSHLHFQLIKNIENYEGDYPGVCKFSERNQYLANCPDPNIILNFTFNGQQ